MQDQNRQKIRENLLNIRRNLDFSLQQISAQKIAVKIFASSVFEHSQNIACYISAKGEVDLDLVIRQIWEQQKKCFLPLLDPDKERRLCFVPYKENDRLVKSKCNVFQPIYDEAKILAPQKLDLVIVPLVGFDIGGARLGQGGGYYDYTFSFRLNDVQKTSKPYLLGVAYEWQKVMDIAVKSWDVKLDAVVTDEALYVF